MTSYAVSFAKKASKLSKPLYATSNYLLKSVTKISKPIYNNIYSSTDSTLTEKISYMSCLLFFKTPFKTFVLDQAYILIGNIPNNYHSYFVNFSNWENFGDNLIYKNPIYNPKTNQYAHNIEINPHEIYMHIKFGDISCKKEYLFENPNYYEYFFSNPKSKLYKLIKHQLNNIKIYDFTKEYGKTDKHALKQRSEKVTDPRFYKYKHQIYGKDMEHVMFIGINKDFL